MNSKQALNKAIEAAGGPAACAVACGVSIQVVSNWRKRGRVSAAMVLTLEAAGKFVVTRFDLRPDLHGPSKVAA